MTVTRYIWPAIGLATVVFCGWLLYNEFRGLSLDELSDSLAAIGWHQWLLAFLSSCVAYLALAGYDHVALMHLGKRVPFRFITACSFATYALAHNIGGSVLSGAVIRYRAYATQGLNGHQIGTLVALCSWTFVLGVLILAAVLLLLQPEVFEGFVDFLPVSATHATGLVLALLIAAYVAGSWIGFRPLQIGSFTLHYPRLRIVLRQLVVAPLELIGAAGIIYFALPDVGNPGFPMILGVFLVSFSAALISHAPGGLGVLEVVFLAGLPDVDPVSVLAALLVFRLFYLLIPLAVSLVLVLLFERAQFRGSRI